MTLLQKPELPTPNHFRTGPPIPAGSLEGLSIPKKPKPEIVPDRRPEIEPSKLPEIEPFAPPEIVPD